jgi:glutaredoxin-dependent peroxiredoxin
MEVNEAIRKRRARRGLDAKKLPKRAVEGLIEAIRLSASCFNNQPWRIVLVQGERRMTQVKESLTKANAWATRSPLLMVVTAKKEEDCALSDRRDYYLFDCGLAVGQCLLAATESGLIAHPIAGYNPEMVRAAVGVPDDHVIITLVVIGFPSDDLSLLTEKQLALEKERPERKSVETCFFKDDWGVPFVQD